MTAPQPRLRALIVVVLAWVQHVRGLCPCRNGCETFAGNEPVVTAPRAEHLRISVVIPVIPYSTTSTAIGGNDRFWCAWYTAADTPPTTATEVASFAGAVDFFADTTYFTQADSFLKTNTGCSTAGEVALDAGCQALGYVYEKDVPAGLYNVICAVYRENDAAGHFVSTPQPVTVLATTDVPVAIDTPSVACISPTAPSNSGTITVAISVTATKHSSSVRCYAVLASPTVIPAASLQARVENDGVDPVTTLPPFATTTANTGAIDGHAFQLSMTFPSDYIANDALHKFDIWCGLKSDVTGDVAVVASDKLTVDITSNGACCLTSAITCAAPLTRLKPQLFSTLAANRKVDVPCVGAVCTIQECCAPDGFSDDMYGRPVTQGLGDSDKAYWGDLTCGSAQSQYSPASFATPSGSAQAVYALRETVTLTLTLASAATLTASNIQVLPPTTMAAAAEAERRAGRTSLLGFTPIAADRTATRSTGNGNIISRPLNKCQDEGVQDVPCTASDMVVSVAGTGTSVGGDRYTTWAVTVAGITCLGTYAVTTSTSGTVPTALAADGSGDAPIVAKPMAFDFENGCQFPGQTSEDGMYSFQLTSAAGTLVTASRLLAAGASCTAGADADAGGIGATCSKHGGCFELSGCVGYFKCNVQVANFTSVFAYTVAEDPLNPSNNELTRIRLEAESPYIYSSDAELLTLTCRKGFGVSNPLLPVTMIPCSRADGPVTWNNPCNACPVGTFQPAEGVVAACRPCPKNAYSTQLTHSYWDAVDVRQQGVARGVACRCKAGYTARPEELLNGGACSTTCRPPPEYNDAAAGGGAGYLPFVMPNAIKPSLTDQFGVAVGAEPKLPCNAPLYEPEAGSGGSGAGHCNNTDPTLVVTSTCVTVFCAYPLEMTGYSFFTKDFFSNNAPAGMSLVPGELFRVIGCTRLDAEAGAVDGKYKCHVKCAAGYTGEAIAKPCVAKGQPFQLTGCRPASFPSSQACMIPTIINMVLLIIHTITDAAFSYFSAKVSADFRSWWDVSNLLLVSGLGFLFLGCSAPSFTLLDLGTILTMFAFAIILPQGVAGIRMLFPGDQDANKLIKLNMRRVKKLISARHTANTEAPTLLKDGAAAWKRPIKYIPQAVVKPEYINRWNEAQQPLDKWKLDVAAEELA